LGEISYPRNIIYRELEDVHDIVLHSQDTAIIRSTVTAKDMTNPDSRKRFFRNTHVFFKEQKLGVVLHGR
jgi:hypothetical protein